MIYFINALIWCFGAACLLTGIIGVVCAGAISLRDWWFSGDDEMIRDLMRRMDRLEVRINQADEIEKRITAIEQVIYDRLGEAVGPVPVKEGGSS